MQRPHPSHFTSHFFSSPNPTQMHPHSSYNYQEGMMQFVTEDQIKGIKAQMEAQYCAKLSRTTVYNHSSGGSVIKLICKLNADRPEKCPFLVEFFEYGQGYLMKENCLSHLPECTLNNEEAFFAKNKLVLESYREDIMKIMRVTPDARPREILDTLIENLGLDPQFLVAGLEGDKHFERRMKKKFDNTILELRNEMNIHVPKQKCKKQYRDYPDRHSRQRPPRREPTLPKRPSPLKEHHSIFGNYQPPIQIVNNLQYFITHQPVVELVNDQDRGTMKIHLINKSKDKMGLSEGNYQARKRAPGFKDVKVMSGEIPEVQENDNFGL